MNATRQSRPWKEDLEADMIYGEEKKDANGGTLGDLCAVVNKSNVMEDRARLWSRCS